MILPLGKFTEFNNLYLKNILNCYQKYFIFKIINDETYLYLDTKVLKEYLEQGFEITHRNYIFLYLKQKKI